MRRFVLHWLVAMLVLPLAGAAPTRLSNGHLQIAIDPQSGALVELLDLQTQWNQAAAGSGPSTLWELEATAESAPVKVLPAQAKSFHCERVGGAGGGLRLTWSDFGSGSAPRLGVHVTIRLEKGLPMSRWELDVGGLGKLVLHKVRFPRLVNLPAQTNEMLAVPAWLGQQTANPRQIFSGAEGRGARSEWAYPGLLSMQCLAFYQPEGPGLYLAFDDSAAFSKAFAFFGDGRGNLSCEAVHFPVTGGAEGLPQKNAENTKGEGGRETHSLAAEQWRLPYGVRVGTFQGDWVTAAERYRAWGTNQVWAKQSRLARGAVPEWVLNTGMWVWNRGRSGQVLSPARVLHQKLGLPVSVFWHWWHGCSYDTGFPEYLPPREGAEPFRNALAAAQAEGLHALVYMNQRLWGMKTQSWQDEGAERFAVKGADGKVHPEVYNTFTQAPCATMCLGTEFWRRKYAGLAADAVRGLGVDGIYMDQACTSLPCYDATHGHPRGGGTYWMEGFRLLANAIHRRAGEQAVLAGEGCGEPWLPYLDLMLSLQVSRERYTPPDGWETIPFFQAVYHAYAVSYGNYSSLTMPPYDDLWPAPFAPQEPLKLLDRKFSRQFYLEQARAFVWGQQPTVANFQPEQFEQRPEEIAYALNLARLRARATKYLLHGTYLRAPELHAPEASVDLSRLSIYAGQQDGLKAFQAPRALVLAGAWRAPDGDIAVALASIADEPLTLSFTADASYYRLPKGAKLYRLDESGRHQASGAQRVDGPINLKLPPRGACLYEFSSRR